MAYENLCMYCFEDLGGHSTCPHCGRDSHAAVPQIQMLPGSLVYHDRFLVGRALGQDATGIVYAAYDTKRGNKLRVREYLPRDCAERLNDGAVVPVPGMEDQFDQGLQKLRASVEGVDDPRKRHFFFEENGTAYIAQRKNQAAASAPTRKSAAAEDLPAEDEGGGRKRIAIIIAIAAVVLIGAAAALYLVLNGMLASPQDVTESPTLDPNQVWIPVETPTTTPYTSPTFAALVDPDLSWMDYTFDDSNTGTPAGVTGVTGVTGTTGYTTARPTATPRPTAAPTLSGDASRYTSVGTKSSQSDIRALQQKLVTLGWLDYSKISGRYDSATTQAVKDFQTYINNSYNPRPKLKVDGIAGPKTQQWLYQTNASRPTPTPKPTATPTPRVTVVPTSDTVVDENSSANLIRDMQRKLIVLGVLPEGSDSGRYDATTRAAVRRFQNRVNQLQGYEVLEVSGNMDSLSMAFLDYYVDEWRKLQTASAAPTVTPTPTATAQPTDTPDPETDSRPVNAQSSKDAIKAVQRRLIAIGLLPEGADDGVYGRSTSGAILAFQQWVNQQRGEQTLTPNGEADALTRAYLKYCEDNGLKPDVSGAVSVPTATPTAEVTAEPTATPTPAPADEPTGEPNEDVDIVIDRNSDRASIRRVQEMLADVGLMSTGGVDGIYGGGTTRAVLAFQEWVNQQGGSLEVSGVVDNATREALEYYSDRGIVIGDANTTPTAEPTDEPTGEPEPTEDGNFEAPTVVPYEPGEGEEEVYNVTIDPNSPTESIHFVQEMLIQLGAMPEDSATGVYDDATRQAVVAFQQWINAQGISSLEVTGIVDDGTRQMLEYCFDHDLRMGLDDEPVVPMETPTPEPTVNPDDPFNEPDEEPVTDDGGVPYTASVEKLDITIGKQLAGDDVIEVSNQNFTVSWEAVGMVESYSVYVSDSAGNPVVSSESTRKTSFKVDTSMMRQGEIYTVTVGAKPDGGSDEDVLFRSARFTLPVPVTPEPTEVPTPEPLPTVGIVEEPTITINGAEAGNTLTEIQGGSFSISWHSLGEVQSYSVQILDANNNVITSQPATLQTGINVNADRMQAGMVYTISVGARPVNGSDADIAWTQAQFKLPDPVTPEPTAEPTPVPTPEPTPEPTSAPTVASVGRPSVTVGGSAYQQGGISYMTDSTIILSWGADGDVAGYVVYVENESGERHNLGTTLDTSRTLSASSLPAGVYTVHVGAIPVNGTQDDAQWGAATFGIPAPTPEPTAEPTPEPEVPAEEPVRQTGGPIDASSDSGTIQQLQMKLYGMGLLPSDAQEGVLDRATLEAVADFQSRANERYQAGLEVIDPTNPNSVVDPTTLTWIARGL